MNFVINFFSRHLQQAAAILAVPVGQIRILKVPVPADRLIPLIPVHRIRVLARMKNRQKSKLLRLQLVINYLLYTFHINKMPYLYFRSSRESISAKKPRKAIAS